MCPSCKEPLITLELEGIEIDHCLECRGVWLDAGELEQIAQRAGIPPGPLSAALEAATAGTRSKRRCPRCRRKLTTVAIGSAPVVEIDRCRRGHGIWFDRGEIRTLVASFAGGEAAAAAAVLSDLLRDTLDADPKGE